MHVANPCGQRGQRQLFALVFLIILMIILSILLFFIIPRSGEYNSSSGLKYEGYDFFKVPAHTTTLLQDGIVVKSGSEVEILDSETTVLNSSVSTDLFNSVDDLEHKMKTSETGVKEESWFYERRFAGSKKIFESYATADSTYATTSTNFPMELTDGNENLSNMSASLPSFPDESNGKAVVDSRNITFEKSQQNRFSLNVKNSTDDISKVVSTSRRTATDKTAVMSAEFFVTGVDYTSKFAAISTPLPIVSSTTLVFASSNLHVHSPNNDDVSLVEDCQILYRKGNRHSGVYDVKLPGVGRKKIFCDMTDDGGWNVIQRRLNGKVGFANRSWKEYEEGFGQLNESFWIGLKSIYSLVKLGNGKPIALRIELRGDRCNGGFRCSGLTNGFWFGEWDFKISNSSSNYALWLSKQKVGNLTLNFPDMFFYMNNGQEFTTVDRDNDKKADLNCAKFHGFGGWWHNSCGYVALNGYYNDSSSYMKGLYWMVKDQNEFSYNVKPRTTEMKVR